MKGDVISIKGALRKKLLFRRGSDLMYNLLVSMLIQKHLHVDYGDINEEMK